MSSQSLALTTLLPQMHTGLNVQVRRGDFVELVCKSSTLSLSPGALIGSSAFVCSFFLLPTGVGPFVRSS